MAANGNTRGQIAVYLEVGSKRIFACAPEWPGWARAGKTEAIALETLALYAPRFDQVAKLAGEVLPPVQDNGFHVLERLTGNASTDFGVPGQFSSTDTRRLLPAEAQRIGALVEAAWEYLARVGSHAPAQLRKGPRGGGRDRDKMLDHVVAAESAYARKLGIKMRELGHQEAAEVRKFRGDLVAALVRPSSGAPPVDNGWPQRYAARRIAWHALDHAWEIEDRS